MYDYLEKVGYGCFCAVLLAWGYIEGLFSMQIHLDLSMVAIAFEKLKAELDVLSFAAFLLVSGVLYFLYRLRGSTTAPVHDGPRFAAFVPTYDDADVLSRSVESLEDSDYEALETYVVCEPGDSADIAEAQRLAEKHDEVEVLVNERYPGTKAGAINHALEVTESEYVGIFDADEKVDPGFLPNAVGKLENDGVDIVQGRTVPEPNGIVESMAYYESVLMSFVLLRLAYLLTGFRMATSRCLAARRATVEDVGGYNPEMLTEDFAFTYKCYRERVSVAEMQQHPSLIDAAHNMTDWWGQRKRWMTGYTQVLHHLVRNGGPYTDHRSLVSIIIAFSTVSGSLFLLTLLSKFAILVSVGGVIAALLPIAIIYGISLGVRLLDHRGGFAPPPSWHFLLVPVVLPIYSFAAVKAMLEYVFTWNGEWYQVTKEA